MCRALECCIENQCRSIWGTVFTIRFLIDRLRVAVNHAITITNQRLLNGNGNGRGVVPIILWTKSSIMYVYGEEGRVGY